MRFFQDLNKQQSLIEKASQRENKTDSVSAFEASEDGPCRWLTKEELESKLGENISEKQVLHSVQIKISVTSFAV